MINEKGAIDLIRNKTFIKLSDSYLLTDTLKKTFDAIYDN